MKTPRRITIRSISSELASALQVEARRRGTSLNQTAKDLLALALGVGCQGARDNELGALAGTWSAEDLAEFENATAEFGVVEHAFWRTPH